MARKTDPASKEAGPYKDVTHRVYHNWIHNSMGAFSGVVNHPIQESSFQYKVIYCWKWGESVHGWTIVNTSITDQCVLNDTKLYITSPLDTRKCCKHFQKGRAKMDQSEHIIRGGSFNTKQSYMVIEEASK